MLKNCTDEECGSLFLGQSFSFSFFLTQSRVTDLSLPVIIKNRKLLKWCSYSLYLEKVRKSTPFFLAPGYLLIAIKIFTLVWLVKKKRRLFLHESRLPQWFVNLLNIALKYISIEFKKYIWPKRIEICTGKNVSFQSFTERLLLSN